MATVVGVVAETRPGERRTALVPAAVALLVASGFQVLVEAGCGVAAGFSDLEYAKAGAEVVEAADIHERAQVIACVTAPRRPTRLRRGQIVVGMLQPWRHPLLIEHWSRRGLTMIGLELAPRIAAARGMDPTGTQARITGRQAVLLAERHLGGEFPMIAPDCELRTARVLVLGAGTIGLQAMTTARLLGSDVTGYTGRADGPAEIAARGARFLQLGSPLVDEDGVRRDISDQERMARRHALDARIGRFDVVITAAGAPGIRPPLLVSADAVAGMRPGSVIVDVAASRYGGNVAGSRPGSTIRMAPGVRLIGAANLPSQAAGLASEYYSDSMVAALRRLCRTGEPRPDLADPLWSAMVLGQRGLPRRPGPAVSVPSQRREPERMRVGALSDLTI